MKNFLHISYLILLIIPGISSKADNFVRYKNILFRQIEIPYYQFQELTPQVKLSMEYANYEMEFDETEKWVNASSHVIPYEIDLVFTKYPVDTTEWRTQYHRLLTSRMNKLFELDSSLQHRKDIRWNMYLQTECNTEDEAKSYFHGFIIKYRPKKTRVIEKVKSKEDLLALITGHARTRDSTVFKVMERNSHWKDMLVVMDWTGSMYKYGVQVVLWHKYHLNKESDNVNHLVFFNDGNNRKTFQKKIGKTGGVYRSKTTDLEEIVKTMLYVMKKGNGGDPPENDLEAILTGVQFLEDYEDIVLIADNKSDVRDLELLSTINKPIRVVICDQRDASVHPDYLKIAFESGGSIHTINDDIYDPSELKLP